MPRYLLSKMGEAVRALATRRIEFHYENIPIRIEGASYRKIVNWLAVEGSIALRREQPWGLPTFLQIEPTTKCNLRCSYCPVSLEHDVPTGHFDPRYAQRLIDEVGETALLMVLWGWGEPFLVDDSYDLIRYARAREIRVLSSTNGHLFADSDRARQLVESGIDYLIVSTSGMSNESYSESRQGEFDLPLLGVQNILEWRRRLGVERPYLSLGLIINRHNQHEQNEAMRRARELGVDLLSLKRLNPTTADSDRALPEDDYFKRFSYGESGARRVEVNPCKALFHKTTLRWDGRIDSCTYDFFGASDLGDLKESSFREIWRGRRYREARRTFRRNYRDIEICTQCTYAFEGGDYEDSVAASFRFDRAGRPTQVAGRPLPAERLRVLSG